VFEERWKLSDRGTLRLDGLGAIGLTGRVPFLQLLIVIETFFARALDVCLATVVE